MAADSESSAHLRRPAESLVPGEMRGRIPAGTPLLGRTPGQGRAAHIDVPHAQIEPNWQILCHCEITNFTLIRRHLGRARADRLAFDAAQIIAGAFTEARVAAKGPALIEVAFEADSPHAATANIESIRQIFASAIDLDGELHALQMAFGLAAAPIHEDDEVRLVEAAESALEQARRDDRTVMFDLSQAGPSFDRLTLMRELPHAIVAGELFLQYQPKVHVRRQTIASAEALVRWQHPTRGLIMPGDFIAAAEESGEIGPLTLWLMRQVIADQQTLAAQGHDIPIFINISGVSLADSNFVEEACRIVTSNKVKIGFEITETSVIRDPEVAIRHLQRFAEIGVTLAIDDYGAGLSSLAYLKQLPAAELKIDKMFVTQLTSSNRDPLIVRSTIDLAHALEMEVTAEGVETPSALALLSVMGCDMVQGYLISRPLGFDAFCHFLAEDGHLAAAPVPQMSFARPEGFWKRA